MANKVRTDQTPPVVGREGKTWMELLTGWKIIRCIWRKNHLAEEFLADIDSILVQVKSDGTVLLGDVNNGSKLPKSFPWSVQFVFNGCEHTVDKLWLICGRLRTIFVLTGNSQDLAMIFATHHAFHFGQSNGGPRSGGDGAGDGAMSPDDSVRPTPTPEPVEEPV